MKSVKVYFIITMCAEIQWNELHEEKINPVIMLYI